MNDPNKRCGTCNYFSRDSKREGQCLRYPPQVVRSLNNAINSYSPHVFRHDKCGEWSLNDEINEIVKEIKVNLTENSLAFLQSYPNGYDEKEVRDEAIKKWMKKNEMV